MIVGLQDGMRIAAVVLFGFIVPGGAAAQTGSPTQEAGTPRLCSTPSGLGTNTCVFSRGTAVVETSLVDWTLDTSDRVKDDTILVGPTIVRLGVSNDLEVQLGWTPFGHERVRDRVNGTRYGSDTIGDVTLGAKAALLAAGAGSLSIAAQPFIVLPTGRAPVGSGKVGGGIVAPIGYELSERVTLELTPEVDLLGNQDGRRRHAEYNVTAGLAAAMTSSLYVTGEYRVLRNDDPLHRRTSNVATPPPPSLAYQPQPRLQLNVGAAAGLTRDSPSVELILGFARRFR